jgi:hypothetical protein
MTGKTRKPRAEDIPYETMLDWMQTVLSEYLDPITIRQLFYQLVTRQLLDNSDGRYKKVSRDCTEARETGEIDPAKIEDRGRASSDGDYPVDINGTQFIQNQLNFLANKYSIYQYPKWTGQPNYVEVWVEKQALQRIFDDVAGRYGVVSSAGKGFTSFTHAHNTAQRFAKQLDAGKTCKLLYFGDFDPSGEAMVSDLIARIEKYGAEGVTIEKIALTKQQVLDWNLPYDFAKVKDSRAAKFIAANGNMCVELDAIPPNKLRSLIETAIKTNVNYEIFDENVRKHEAERAVIKEWCASVTKTLEGAK